MGACCAKNIGKDSPKKKSFIPKEKVEHDEFEVPPENKVAEYDPKELAQNWNRERTREFEKKNLLKRLLATWKHGILGTALRIFGTYGVLYYIINIAIIQFACARDYPMEFTMMTPYQEKMLNAMTNQGNNATFATNNATNITERAYQRYKKYGCMNYEATFASFAQKEMAFTRILTFLLGFYVSFTINRWWRQITSIPSIDGLCIALGSFIWVDPSKKEDEVCIKEGCTIKEFKHTITRYCLLSWTMVMSTVDQPSADEFKNPIDFNQKGLLTYEEYIRLKTNKGGDTWKSKWALPLIWAGSMLCEASQKTKDANFVRIKEIKEIMGTIQNFQDRLSDVLRYDENQVPDMIVQAIRLATYFWIFMGIFASQGLVNKEHNVPLGVALLMNFPLFEIVKFVLVMSWLKTAMYLQNPFGGDE